MVTRAIDQPPIGAESPKVSIGLPVFNGGRYVPDALESLITQTYEDLEIVVCDNCSTDGTQSIVRKFAKADRRIRYVRNAANIGLARNFNRAFTLSAGQYFKWMAHDDVCGQDFVRRCVEVLDDDPSVVLAYPSPLDIDEYGHVIGPRDADLDFTKENAFERFRDQMIKAHAGLHLFGLVRSDVLRRTSLHPNYPGGDRVLLAELALYGKFREIPEQLYLHREHPRRGTYSHPTLQEMMAAYRPERSGRLSFPTWALLIGYLSAATRAPISLRERALCYIQMAAWCKGKRHNLLGDLHYAVRLLRSRGR